MLEQAIKRMVQRLFPELTGKLHLPQWGRIEAVHAIESADKSTQADPRYCVDVQVLDGHGAPDSAVPVFSLVPLPATGAGNVRGLFAYPPTGTLVELGFVLGQPDKPFIRSVLVQETTPPQLTPTDVALHQDAANFYRINEGGHVLERCQAIADRLADIKQRLRVKDGGKMWVGNESDNVLTLLSDLMAEVITIANDLATHKHSGVQAGTSNTAAPTTAATYSGASSAVGELKSTLDGIKE